MSDWPSEYQSPDQGSKYGLVVAVAKRARQIVNRRDPGVLLPHKPVILALNEIAEGAIRVVTQAEAPQTEVLEAAISDTPDTETESEIADKPEI